MPASLTRCPLIPGLWSLIPDRSVSSADVSLDLLAFGPHPDDIEIGMGATVALHAADGRRVGLCDLTRGELGSNGTPEERVRGRRSRSRSPRRAVRSTSGSARRQPVGRPARSGPRGRRVIRATGRARLPCPTGTIAIPTTSRLTASLTGPIVRAGLRRSDGDGDPWRPDWVCHYFINDTRHALVPGGRVRRLRPQARVRWRATARQFAPAAAEQWPTRLTSPTFTQLVESRDAQFGALAGVR